MGVLKTLGALILSTLMIGSVCFCMASFAAEAATSEASIEAAVEESGIMDEVKSGLPMDQLNAINSNLGEAAEDVLESDGVKEAISAYLAKAIRAEMEGEELPAVSEGEIEALISDVVDEKVSDGGLDINQQEAQVMKRYIGYTVPSLTRSINSQIDSYADENISEESKAAIEGVKIIASRGFRYGTMVIAGLCAIILILMYWASKLGFVWCGINMFISSIIYILMTAAASDMGEAASSASQRMVLIMFKNGTGSSAVIGAIIGVLMLILCVIMRLASSKARCV